MLGLCLTSIEHKTAARIQEGSLRRSLYWCESRVAWHGKDRNWKDSHVRELRNSNDFQREDFDIYTESTVDVFDAILGTSIKAATDLPPCKLEPSWSRLSMSSILVQIRSKFDLF